MIPNLISLYRIISIPFFIWALKENRILLLQNDQNAQLKLAAGTSLAEIEKEAIKRTLRFYQYDKNKTAMSLQIGLATLYRKMKEYGLDHD